MIEIFYETNRVESLDLGDPIISPLRGINRPEIRLE